MDMDWLTIMIEKSRDRPISNYLFHAQIKTRTHDFCDVTLASVDGQKFKAYQFILSVSSILWKKLLLKKILIH